MTQREIKLRVFDKVKNQFCPINSDCYQIQYQGDCWLISCSKSYDPTVFPFTSLESDRFIVSQYTGLKNRDGKEIYEGDILGFLESSGNKALFEVKWGKAYSGYQWCEFEIRNWSGQIVSSSEPDNFYGGISDYKVVVGNIYENPELCTTSNT